MMLTTQFSACARPMRPRRSWRAPFRAGSSSPVLAADYVAGQFGIRTRTGFDSLHDFSRSSEATHVAASGLLAAAAINAPRFDHQAIGGAPLGLLIEGTRSNALSRSQNISNAIWAKDNVTVLAEAALAPDGSTSAEKILDTATFGHHRVKQFGLSVTAGNAYTASFFAKAAGRNVYMTLFDGSGAWSAACRFDLQAGSIVSPSGSTLIGARIEPAGNGWYRCALTANAVGNSTNAQVLINVLDGLAMYAGDGLSGAYLWGAQLEVGRAASSYIPTQDVTATRSADRAEIGLGDWFNPTAGTVLAEVALRRGEAGRHLWSLHDAAAGGNALGVRFASPASGALEAVSLRGGVVEAQIALGSAAEFSVARVALSHAPGRIAASLNGGAAQVGTGVSPAGGYLTLQPGGLLTTAGNAHLRKIAYWSHALDDAELQALSGAG